MVIIIAKEPALKVNFTTKIKCRRIRYNLHSCSSAWLLCGVFGIVIKTENFFSTKYFDVPEVALVFLGS